MEIGLSLPKLLVRLFLELPVDRFDGELKDNSFLAGLLGVVGNEAALTGIGGVAGRSCGFTTFDNDDIEREESTVSISPVSAPNIS